MTNALDRIYAFSAAKLGCSLALLGILGMSWHTDPVFSGIALDRLFALVDVSLILALLHAERNGQDVAESRRERTAAWMRRVSGVILLFVGAGVIAMSYHFAFGQDSHHREPERVVLVFLPAFFVVAGLELLTKRSIEEAVSPSLRMPGIRDHRYSTLVIGTLGPAIHYVFGFWFAKPAAGFVIGLILMHDAVRRLRGLD